MKAKAGTVHDDSDVRNLPIGKEPWNNGIFMGSLKSLYFFHIGIPLITCNNKKYGDECFMIGNNNVKGV